MSAEHASHDDHPPDPGGAIVTRDSLDAALARLELRITLRLGGLFVGLVTIAVTALGLLIKL